MAVRGALGPLSGLICEIVVNSLGQGNFTFFQKSQGKIQGNSKTSGCGNHVLVMLFYNLMFHMRCDFKGILL